MNEDITSRRNFLGQMAAVAAATMAGKALAEDTNRLHIACNQYPWLVFYQREGKDFNKMLDTGLGELESSGM
ncbi:MAG: sugar phosphate isomerase/epimerase, partial [Planctomycetota bacterium]